jgi:hypothetical protein
MKRSRLKWSMVSLLALCALPLIGEAQESQRPMNMDPAERMRRWAMRAGDGGGASTRPFVRMPTEEEWTKVSAFMQQELPNSWSLFQRMPENVWRREEAKRRIFQRYQELHKDKDSPALFEVKLKQAKLGDEILPLVAEVREANDADRPALEGKLRSKVKEKIDAELKERELKIQDLAQKLEKEKVKLSEDRVKMEASLDARVKNLIRGDNSGVRPGDGMRRRGEGEPAKVGMAE